MRMCKTPRAFLAGFAALFVANAAQPALALLAVQNDSQQSRAQLQKHQNPTANGPENFLEASGSERSLFPHLIGLRQTMVHTIDRAAAFASTFPDLPPELVSAWERAIRATFDPETMVAHAITLFASEMTRAEEQEVIAFFQTDVGKRLKNARQAFRERPVETPEGALLREEAMAQSDPTRHAYYAKLGAIIQGEPDIARIRFLSAALWQAIHGETASDADIETLTATVALPDSGTIFAMQLLPEMTDGDLAAILDFFQSTAGHQLAQIEAGMSLSALEAQKEELSKHVEREANLTR
ncbi:DUF2059 domain-containing protein [Aureimonas fodinaquatilis]|uniref:DUF2059 domain-containing protein n=1 Tax=Aureimonas fodinaquatilis TaxID=2565783 RepID=A0A5B0DP14_9HYPH|nr:DUF2059 domain-containing protein [Aureimonas fodinaquatilis]KAA0968143.1 DUF2059 domain-containing protein [Aureimonas fodinaquatilis]